MNDLCVINIKAYKYSEQKKHRFSQLSLTNENLPE